MKSMKWQKFLILAPVCILILNGQAQEPKAPQDQPRDEILKSLREKMRKDHEMIDRLFNDDAFTDINRDFHGRFKKLLEDFYQGSPEDFFYGQKFDQFFRESLPNGVDGPGRGDWLDSPNECILILTLDVPKDSPLDIKIEKGIIHVAGKTKRRQRSLQGESMEEVQFQKAFPIPMDCIAGSAQFENSNGQIKIRLRKKTSSTQKPTIVPNVTPGIRPLAPKQGDITL